MFPNLKAIAKIRMNFGICPICNGHTLFIEHGPWLRDQYLCARCKSIPRNRALLLTLSTLVTDFKGLSIHESSPDGPLSAYFAKECPMYLPTQFYPDVPSGKECNGVRCENLESQSFPDGSFDLVITQDVMEHVLNPAAAFAEIARTLKVGGAHIFTVPYYSGAKTVSRAIAGRDGVEYRAEKLYHGNPVDPAGSLVVTEWGNDLVEFIEKSSGLQTKIFRTVDRKRGIDGEFLEVFVSRKF